MQNKVEAASPCTVSGKYRKRANAHKKPSEEQLNGSALYGDSTFQK